MTTPESQGSCIGTSSGLGSTNWLYHTGAGALFPRACLNKLATQTKPEMNTDSIWHRNKKMLSWAPQLQRPTLRMFAKRDLRGYSESTKNSVGRHRLHLRNCYLSQKFSMSTKLWSSPRASSELGAGCPHDEPVHNQPLVITLSRISRMRKGFPQRAPKTALEKCLSSLMRVPTVGKSPHPVSDSSATGCPGPSTSLRQAK